MQLHRYTEINPLRADADTTREKNIFFGLDCYVIDYHACEMSGSDCAIAWVTPSREALVQHFIDRGYRSDWAESLVLEGGGYEYMLAEMGIELPSGFHYHVGPGFKCYLKPHTQEGAKALLAAELKDSEHLREYKPADTEYADWFNIQHREYHMEKLGRVILNCSPLL